MAFSASVFGGNRLRSRPLLGGRRHRSKRHHSRMGRARSVMSLFGSRKSHRRMRRSGSGFLSDAWDKIKSVGSHVLPIALPILKDLAVKAVRSRLGLGKRRKSRRRSRMGGIIGSFGYGRKRRSHRRRRVGSRKRRSHRSRRLGSRKRRTRLRRGSRRRSRSHHRRGRGAIGSAVGGVLGSLIPWF